MSHDTDDARALAARIDAAVRVLEEVADDLPQLAGIDDALRARLVIAAGRVSRPDRYVRKLRPFDLLSYKKRIENQLTRALTRELPNEDDIAAAS